MCCPCNTKKSCVTSGIRGRNYAKADFESLYKDLAMETWSATLEASDPDSAAESFSSTFNLILNNNIPQKYNKSHYKYPNWYTSNIICKIKEKEKFRRKYKRSGKDVHLQRYRLLRTESKGMLSAARRRYERSIEDRLKSDPKQFWHYIATKRGAGPSAGIYITGTQSLSDAQSIANAFATFFEENFSNPGQSHLFCATNSQGTVVSVNSISKQEVIDTMSKMLAKRAEGTDGIPPYIYKGCRELLAEPLMHIFNLILTTGSFPRSWKISKIIPIPKTKDQNKIELHRPIAIVPAPSKIFETILCHKIFWQVKHLICGNQHGFIPGRSVVTNLGVFMDDVAGVIDMGGQVDVICTDFQKAFDKVDHGILLSKLNSMGFSHNLLSILRSYLTERKLVVHFRGAVSRY